MNIILNEEVINYLEKKNKKSFFLDIKTSGGGCCPTFEIAEIELGEPDNPNLYNVQEVDGTKIFISNRARIISTLTFKLQKNLLTQSIVVSGLQLKQR